MKMPLGRVLPVLLVLTLLLLVTTCGDEPPVAPDESPVEPAVSVATIEAQALSTPARGGGTVREALQDPFIRLLIGSLTDRAAAQAFNTSATAFFKETRSGDIRAAQLTLISARSKLEEYAGRGDLDPDDVVTLAALRHTLAHAEPPSDARLEVE